MSTSSDVIDSVETQFGATEEFGVVFEIHKFVLSSAVICLNKKDIQFTLSGAEVPVFLEVINGISSDHDLCTLRPASKSEVPGYVGLRVLQFGRFMIHFTEAELDRFIRFLNKKFFPHSLEQIRSNNSGVNLK
jgi:hypothetical protein